MAAFKPSTGIGRQWLDGKEKARDRRGAVARGLGRDSLECASASLNNAHTNRKHPGLFRAGAKVVNPTTRPALLKQGGARREFSRLMLMFGHDGVAPSNFNDGMPVGG